MNDAWPYPTGIDPRLLELNHAEAYDHNTAPQVFPSNGTQFGDDSWPKIPALTGSFVPTTLAGPHPDMGAFDVDMSALGGDFQVNDAPADHEQSWCFQSQQEDHEGTYQLTPAVGLTSQHALPPFTCSPTELISSGTSQFSNQDRNIMAAQPSEKGKVSQATSSVQALGRGSLHARKARRTKRNLARASRTKPSRSLNSSTPQSRQLSPPQKRASPLSDFTQFKTPKGARNLTSTQSSLKSSSEISRLSNHTTALREAIALVQESIKPFSPFSRRKATDLIKQLAEVANQLDQLAIEEEKYGNASSDDDESTQPSTSVSTQDSLSNSELVDVDSETDNTSISSSSQQPVVEGQDCSVENEQRDPVHRPCLQCGHKSLYYCTRAGCNYSIHSSAEWRRHEESQKHSQREKFMCLECPRSPAATDLNGDPLCEFCRATFPGLGTNLAAHYLQCQAAQKSCTTYGRKDRLMGHLRTQHRMNANVSQLAAAGKYTIDFKWPTICGFCGVTFMTWDERMDHIAGHFEDGLDMSSWKPPSPPPKDLHPGFKPRPKDGDDSDDDMDDNDNRPSGRKTGGQEQSKRARSSQTKSATQQKGRGASTQRGRRHRQQMAPADSDDRVDSDMTSSPDEICGTLVAEQLSKEKSSQGFKTASVALDRYLNDIEEPFQTQAIPQRSRQNTDVGGTIKPEGTHKQGGLDEKEWREISNSQKSHHSSSSQRTLQAQSGSQQILMRIEPSALPSSGPIYQQPIRIQNITPPKLMDDAACLKRLTTYSAFTIRKCPRCDPKKEGRGTRARSEIIKEKWAQEDIIKQIKKLNDSRRSVADKKKALMPNQQVQVTTLVDNLASGERDDAFEWSLVQLDSFIKPESIFKRGKTREMCETTTMTIYVKRSPRKDLYPVVLFQNIEKMKAESTSNNSPPPSRSSKAAAVTPINYTPLTAPLNSNGRQAMSLLGSFKLETTQGLLQSRSLISPLDTPDLLFPIRKKIPDESDIFNGYQGHSAPATLTQEMQRRKRRESHNLVGRGRRDNIHERIEELRRLFPKDRLEDEKACKELQKRSPSSPTMAGSPAPCRVAIPHLAMPDTTFVPRSPTRNIKTGIPNEENSRGLNKGDIFQDSLSGIRESILSLQHKIQELEESDSRLCREFMDVAAPMIDTGSYGLRASATYPRVPKRFSHVESRPTPPTLRGTTATSAELKEDEYPLRIPPEELSRALKLYNAFKLAESEATEADGIARSITVPRSIASPITFRTSPKRRRIPFTSGSSPDELTDYGSVISFGSRAASAPDFTSFDGKKVIPRQRRRLTPVARAKAALVRYLGSCPNCTSRRVHCPLEHHDIQCLEELRASNRGTDLVSEGPSIALRLQLPNATFDETIAYSCSVDMRMGDPADCLCSVPSTAMNGVLTTDPSLNQIPGCDMLRVVQEYQQSNSRFISLNYTREKSPRVEVLDLIDTALSYSDAESKKMFDEAFEAVVERGVKMIRGLLPIPPNPKLHDLPHSRMASLSAATYDPKSENQSAFTLSVPSSWSLEAVERMRRMLLSVTSKFDVQSLGLAPKLKTDGIFNFADPNYEAVDQCELGCFQCHKPISADRPPNYNCENCSCEYGRSRYYRAPEIILSCMSNQASIDVWSFDYILGTLLGSRSFSEAGERELIHSLNKNLKMRPIDLELAVSSKTKLLDVVHIMSSKWFVRGWTLQEMVRIMVCQDDIFDPEVGRRSLYSLSTLLPRAPGVSRNQYRLFRKAIEMYFKAFFLEQRLMIDRELQLHVRQVTVTEMMTREWFWSCCYCTNRDAVIKLIQESACVTSVDGCLFCSSNFRFGVASIAYDTIRVFIVLKRTGDHEAFPQRQWWKYWKCDRRHLMDWEQSLGSLALGGGSSSQCRGLVMTLLAVDNHLLYFLLTPHFAIPIDILYCVNAP